MEIPMDKLEEKPLKRKLDEENNNNNNDEERCKKEHWLFDIVTDPIKRKYIFDNFSEKNRRSTVESIIENDGMVKHQLHCFDKFVSEFIPEIFSEKSEIEIISGDKKHILTLGKVTICSPMNIEANADHREVMPSECMLRDLCYRMPINIDIRHQVYKKISAIANSGISGIAKYAQEENNTYYKLKHDKTQKEVCVALIPVPIGSEYCHTKHTTALSDQCPHDQGGVFIVNGKPKLFVFQSVIKQNTIFVFANKSGSKFHMASQIRSRGEKFRSTSNTLIHLGKNIKMTRESFVSKNEPGSKISDQGSTMDFEFREVSLGNKGDGEDDDDEQVLPQDIDPYDLGDVEDMSIPQTMEDSQSDTIQNQNQNENENENENKKQKENDSIEQIDSKKQKISNDGAIIENTGKDEMDDSIHLSYNSVVPKGKKIVKSFACEYLAAVSIPFIYFLIPLPVMYRIMGVSKISDMKKRIMVFCQTEGDELQQKKNHLNRCHVSNFLDKLFEHDIYDQSPEELCEWLGRKGTKQTVREKRINAVKTAFKAEFLPHIGTDDHIETIEQKLRILSLMIYKLTQVQLGQASLDDKDNLATKTEDTVGSLMANLIRGKWKQKITKEIPREIQKFEKKKREKKNKEAKNGENKKVKLVLDLNELFNPKGTTNAISYALATGNWGPRKGNSSVTGVVQVDSHMTKNGAFFNARRTNIQISKDGKNSKHRQLHVSAKGYIDPNDTPEGEQCGTVTTFTITSHIRLGISPKKVMCVLKQDLQGLIPFADNPISSKYMICVCSIPIGFVSDPKSCYQQLRYFKRIGKIPFDSTLFCSKETKTIEIDVDHGCITRPVFALDKLYLWDKFYYLKERYDINSWIRIMIYNGLIEYISAKQESILKIAVHPRDILNDSIMNSEEPYTHLELHETCMFGCNTAISPFPDHSPSPRNTYQSVHSKQCISMNRLNQNHRPDVTSQHLFYPQKPLVQTYLAKVLKAEQFGNGQDVIFAIITRGAYNIEDSIILNKTSIDMGKFRSLYTREYQDQEKTKGQDPTSFGKLSDSTRSTKIANHDKIANNGLAPIGSLLDVGDAIIAKRKSTEHLEDKWVGNKVQRIQKTVGTDMTTCLKGSSTSRVYSIIDTVNKEGNRFVRMGTIHARTPKVGDKFSSRHGQKGTVGQIMHEEDMPFTQSGIIPDVIFNPNGMPSRMTLSSFRETMLGKICCLEGGTGDGTPFYENNDETISLKTDKDIGDILVKNGFSSDGTEIMIDGTTGEQLECRIFIGPQNYQRLRHMPEDKMHARQRGPVQILTRQPQEGRSREGGLRFGEMERDCVMSHGGAEFLKERLFEQSDPYETTFCTKCGMMCFPKVSSKKWLGTSHRGETAYCKLCKTAEFVELVKFPYACKLLFQELMACHILPRVEFSKPTVGSKFTTSSTSTTLPTDGIVSELNECGEMRDQDESSAIHMSHSIAVSDRVIERNYNPR